MNQETRWLNLKQRQKLDWTTFKLHHQSGMFWNMKQHIQSAGPPASSETWNFHGGLASTRFNGNPIIEGISHFCELYYLIILNPYENGSMTIQQFWKTTSRFVGLAAHWHPLLFVKLTHAFHIKPGQ
jgi:hypothetical protein